jgi:diguanylate cyclase (GGDEF)-like protein
MVAHCPPHLQGHNQTMKISDSPRPTSRTAPATRSSAAAGVRGGTIAPGISAVIEPSHVMGIPVAELTPRVRDVLMTLMQEVEALRRELNHTKEKLTEVERVADTDTLSPIANRRAFVRELSRVMSYAERYNIETSLLFFDVDGLKDVNDTHGHAAGDAVLMHVADALRANIRTSDYVGRLGGDEFAVILSHANEEQAMQKADLLQSRICDVAVPFEGKELRTAASVGVYTFGPGETPTNVIAAADKIMYQQKQIRRAQRST